MRNKLGSTDSATIIPIILTSDKTHLTGTGKVKLWPVMMTIGNVSNSVRFKPGQHCAQLIAMLPVFTGTTLGIWERADDLGIASHGPEKEVREWRRKVFHSVIRSVMEPIQRVMETGIILPCADGASRWCFPVLCQYIADMEEQWLLTNLVKPSCLKCWRRGTRDDITNEEFDGWISEDDSAERVEVGDDLETPGNGF